MEPFQDFHDLICTIPGISTLTADVIVAETGADMSESRAPNISLPGPGPRRVTTSPPAR